MSLAVVPELSAFADREAEQSVLGSLMLDHGAIHRVASRLRAEDFAEERHGLIYRAAVELGGRGEPLDLVTLRSELERQGSLAKAGGVDYIAELTIATPSAVSAEHYAALVAECSERRRRRDSYRRAGAALADPGQPVSAADAIVDDARASGAPSTSEEGIAEGMAAAWARCEQAQETHAVLVGVPSGLDGLDMRTTGWLPGQLIVLAAASRTGKSSLARQFVRAAAGHRVPTHLFSIEMDRRAQWNAMLASESRVDSLRLRQGTASDYAEVARAIERLRKLPITMDDSPSLSAADIRSRCLRRRAKGGLGLVVVDYLQKMRGSRRDMRERVEENSEGLRTLARELNVPVIMLSQINREGEKAGGQPQLYWLRDSGAIGQDADTVMILERRADDPRRLRGDGTMTVDLWIVKQRAGAEGCIPLVFHGPTTRFWEESM